MHYAALTCDDEVLEQRLRSRPKWRKSGDPAIIEEQVRFNGWFRDQSRRTDPMIELIETSGDSVEETAEWVAEWIRGRITYSHSTGSPA